MADQVIKKKVLFRELEATAQKMREAGLRLVCMMPELVNTYDVGESSEYTLPTTVCCVFERLEPQKS